MSDGRDDEKIVLRVDRLAAAMDAARARAARDAGERIDAPHGRTPSAQDEDALTGSTETTAVVAPVKKGAPAPDGAAQPDADERPEPERDEDALTDEPLVLSVDAIVDAPDIAADPCADLGPVEPPCAPASETQPVSAMPAASAPDIEHAEPAPQMSPSVLSVRGVQADIGRVPVLDGVDLDVPSGQVTALLGRKGAGKTTTLRTIMGLVPTTAGQIQFAGEQIAGWPPDRIARRGVGYVPASTGVFERLTVSENMRLAARTWRLPQDRVDWVLRTFPALHAFWKTPAGRLSSGHRQMLAIARAVIENRRLYLIDDPTSGLAPDMAETIVGALRDLKLQGATVLLAGGDVTVANSLARTCAVMSEGRIVWTGETAALSADPDLQTRWLGQGAEIA